MNFTEAERILEIVGSELEDDSRPFGQHPISALQGYDMVNIFNALKLRIANEYLLLARRLDFEKQFADGLKLYDSIPWQIMRSFVADNEVGKINARPVLSPIDPTTMKFANEQLVSIETGSSFGDYCKSVGIEDPDYWQKIYTRIGIIYTSESPKRNIPVTFR